MKRTALVRKTPLVRNTTLRKVSKKQAVENKEWMKIKAERIERLKARFDYLPCEYCHVYIRESDFQDPHHNDRNRRHNTFHNMRILHRNCHTWIHDHNIMDVPSLLGE